MADAVLKNTKVALMAEQAEGTYVTPASGADFIGVMEDGVNDIITPAKEALERGQLTATMDKLASRSGIRSANGKVAVEYKAGTSGAEPEYGLMVKSALGTSSASVLNVTAGTTNTTTLIKMASTTGFAAGDIVGVRGASGGLIHVSPIASIVLNTSITLLVAKATAFADACVVDKLFDYRIASSGHPSFSLTRFTEDTIKDTAAGCKTIEMSIDKWSTGQMPTLSFGFEGMAYTRTLEAPAYTPSMDTSLPVIALHACVYKDGFAVPINELKLSIKNTLGWKTSTCSSNGRISSRVTSRELTGSFNPYIATDSIANFTAWEADTTYSLFYWTGNPTATAGEYSEVVAGYLSVCQTTERKQSDADGLLQEELSFTARAHDTLPLMIMAYK